MPLIGKITKIVLAAVQENHLARNFASDELQIDKEIIAAFENDKLKGQGKRKVRCHTNNHSINRHDGRNVGKS